MTRISLTCALVALPLIAASTPAAAPGQTYPGQATQARVWIQNHGRGEAVPMSIQEIASDTTMKVQVVGTPSVAIAAPDTLATRHARQGWEYQRVLLNPTENDISPQLNALGSNGWEAAFQYPTPSGGLVVVFKRPNQAR
jgi:hypothetical protein